MTKITVDLDDVAKVIDEVVEAATKDLNDRLLLAEMSIKELQTKAAAMKPVVRLPARRGAAA